MQFLYPQFLFALAALSIPVIIHLFNFRRYKKVYFTNVKFLTDVQQEHRSRNRLRHLILLLLRMLALACLVLAFAHPFIPLKNAAVNPGKKYVSVFVDNSFSMGNLSASGELLETARRQAEEIANRYKEGDGFQLVTNDFELRHQRWVNRTEFLDLVQEVNLSPAFRKLSDIYARMNENFRKAENNNRDIYLLSDFQKNMADFDALEADSNTRVTISPLAANEQNNVFIDSVWFDSPVLQADQADTLYVKIVNASEQDVEEGTLTFKINGRQKGIASYTIAAGSERIVNVVFTVSDAGVNLAEVSLEDYPIKFDNTFYFNFRVADKIRVLAINAKAPNTYISRAYAAEPSFELTNTGAGAIDYAAFSRYDLIILNELPEIPSGLATSLQDFLDTKGNVLVAPPAEGLNVQNYNSSLGMIAPLSFGGRINNSLTLQQPDLSLPFFANIFEDQPRNVAMPAVKSYYKISGFAAVRSNTLYSLNNGDPYLSMQPLKAGFLFLAAAPFQTESGSFPDHSLFLPTLYKMALYRRHNDKLYHIIDKDNYLQVPNGVASKENIYRLIKDSIEFIPPQKLSGGTLSLFVEGLVEQPGYYKLDSREGNNNDSGLNVYYSFNFDRQESEMKFLTTDDIKERAAGLDPVILSQDEASVAHQLSEIQEGEKLWKWFVLLALAFIVAETLLIRFWK